MKSRPEDGWAASGLGLQALLLTAGAVPFLLGTLLARASGYEVRLAVTGLGLGGVLALHLAALAAREAFGPPAGRWPALGGWPPGTWHRAGLAFLGAAGGVGLLLQFLWETGDLTLPLGGFGVLLGYFAFAPPLAWWRRGWGELAGALGFGLLPVLTGYYLQCGHAITEILLLGLPLSFAAFNLFLILGMPPEQAGPQPASGSLGSRLSPPAVGLLFTGVNILTIIGLTTVLLFPAPASPARFGLFLLLGLALVNQELVKRRAYAREDRLRLLARLLMVQQLGMGLVFAWGLWGRL